MNTSFLRSVPLLGLAALAGAACGFAPLVQAQTVWSGADGANLTTAANWSPAVVPSSTNPGTINASTGNITFNGTLNGYFVTQNGGILGNNTVGRVLNNGTWTINGGSMTNGNTITIQGADNGNQNFTISGGSVSATSFQFASGGTGRTATVTISSGNLTSTSAGMGSGSGATINISGGTITSATLFGGGGNFTMTGGTVIAGSSFSTAAGFSMTLGGTTLGAITAVNWGGTDTARNFNWLAGTKITMTLSGVSSWAETEWDANRLRFNGQTKTGLGGLSWADATNPTVGLGGGYSFDYTGNTLALVPEPSSWALLTVGLTALVLFRRRRRLN